jgi:hypothetical protein
MKNWLASSKRSCCQNATHRQATDWIGGRMVSFAAGVVIFGLGVILFFAYNWADMHRFVKLALIGTGLIAAHGPAVWFGHQDPTMGVERKSPPVGHPVIWCRHLVDRADLPYRRTLPQCLLALECRGTFLGMDNTVPYACPTRFGTCIPLGLLRNIRLPPSPTSCQLVGGIRCNSAGNNSAVEHDFVLFHRHIHHAAHF